jgi:hypothetical protein
MNQLPTLLATSLLLFATSSSHALQIVSNPNPAVPMAAVLTDVPANVDRLDITAASMDHTFSIALDSGDKLGEGYPLIGFRPDRSYQLAVRGYSEGRLMVDDDGFVFASPPLPVDSREWPVIDYQAAESAALEPGFVFLSVRRNSMSRPFRMTKAQRIFTEGWGLILALDTEGEVVWYYRSPQRTSGIDRLDNGNIFFHTAYSQSVEIDLLGNRVREYQPEFNPRVTKNREDALLIKGIQTLHHQPHQLPNGNFLAFSSNEREVENYFTSEFDADAPRKTQRVNGDTIIEFTPEGDIVWEWDAFDHLPLERIGYNLTDPYWWVRGFPGNLDWTHGNGISYDLKDDAVIVYLKHQDAALKIRRATGEIVWIFGEPTDWPETLQPKLLQKQGDFAWPYHAHNPRMTINGSYILYENGQWGARPFTGVPTRSPNESFSRAAEYEIDEEAMEVREVWSSHREKSDDTCYAPGMGDAHVLPQTGHVLVVDPVCFDQDSYELTEEQRDFTKRHNSELNHSARIREYSHTRPAKVLREWVIRDRYETVNWQVYGGFHSPTLYRKAVSH